MSTWFSRTPSQQTSSLWISRVKMSKRWPFSFTWGWTMLTMLSMVSRNENSSRFSVSLPLSILDMSSTSLMSPSRCRLERVIFRRQSRTWSGLSMFAVAMAVMPTIAFIGVRMSWLMLERNSLLAWLASSASFWARSTSSSCRRDMRK